MNVKKNAGKVRTKLPIHIYLGYLLVVTLIFSGVTFSKYIASTSAGDGARVATFGDLELYELDAAGDRLPEKETYMFSVAPGVDMHKQPVVDFAADEKNSEMAAYLFVTVNASGWSYSGTVDGPYTYQITRQTDQTTLIQWKIAEGWTLFSADEAGRQIFYRVVEANNKLTQADIMAPLGTDDKNTIFVSEHLYASELEILNNAAKSIVFKAYAVQTQGFPSADEAWHAIEGK